MKTIYFDCFSGVSGDMIVGALIDLGVALDDLEKALSTLSVKGYALRAEKVVKKGVQAPQFTVELDPGVKQPHRHLHHVLDIINAGDLPEFVKAASAETFRRIAVAEAEVHGTTIEKVHFHEVGAIDSIVDVVGAHLGLHLLGVEKVYASAVHAGSGTVKCAHGVMPVPAPATALLLNGVPWYGGEVDGELATPTGVALIGQLASRFGPMRSMGKTRVGWGSGTRDIPDRPNVLRVFLGEEAETARRMESIVVIEANVDDMTPELIAEAIGGAIRAGARDAFVAPIVGKKGRPGHMLTVLCDEQQRDALAGLLFESTSTFGVRMRREERICLDRTWKTAATPWGPVRVKVGKLDGKQLRAAPEFEDCRKAAEAGEVAVMCVYEAALAAAVKGELADE
jgi:hypothetical protein